MAHLLNGPFSFPFSNGLIKRLKYGPFRNKTVTTNVCQRNSILEFVRKCVVQRILIGQIFGSNGALLWHA